MLPDINQVRNCYTDIPDGINNETIQITYFSDFNKDGYRRAGKLLYKNICPQCKKCQPIRIPISSFVPSKSQRKVLRINSDITQRMNLDSKSFISDDKIELYRRYSLKHESKMKTRKYQEVTKVYEDCKTVLKKEEDFLGLKVYGLICEFEKESEEKEQD